MNDMHVWILIKSMENVATQRSTSIYVPTYTRKVENYSNINP